MRESMKNNGQTRLVRRCRLRIFLGAAALILGAAALTAALASSAGASPILYLEPESRSFMTSFVLRHRLADHCRSFIDFKKPFLSEGSGAQKAAGNPGV